MSELHIGHLHIDSPFSNAGGVVKHVEDVERMAHTGTGWIEAGSYTLEQRDGNGVNGEVVYYHDSEEGKTYNSLGMPNKGMDVVEAEIPEMANIAHNFDKPLVVNVAPVSDEPAPETLELVSRAYEAGADAVLLNAGCPNVLTDDQDGRHEILSRDAEALGIVLRGLREVTEIFKPVFIRVSPAETITRVKEITGVIKDSGVVNAIFTPNTWPGHQPLDHDGQPILEVPGGTGGMSGPASADAATRQAAWAKLGLGRSAIDIVSSGGIVDGRELATRLVITQSVAGSGTTFFYESGDWEHDVDKLLWEFQDSQRKFS